MTQPRSKLLFALLLAGGACAEHPLAESNGEMDATAPSFATSVQNICSNMTPPWGLVVLSGFRDAGCPNYNHAYNAYSVGIPNPAGETVCFPATELLPNGFVVLRITAKKVCPGYGRGAVNALRIKKAITPEWVCTSWPAPSGWVYVAYVRASRCPGEFGAYTSARIRPVQPGNVCSSSPIPAGWVHKHWGRSEHCPSYSATGFNVINLNRPVAGQTVCLTSTLPSGWSYSRYGRSRGCPNYSSTGPGNTGVLKRS
jgi:hypothetical protein